MVFVLAVEIVIVFYALMKILAQNALRVNNLINYLRFRFD